MMQCRAPWTRCGAAWVPTTSVAGVCHCKPSSSAEGVSLTCVSAPVQGPVAQGACPPHPVAYPRAPGSHAGSTSYRQELYCQTSLTRCTRALPWTRRQCTRTSSACRCQRTRRKACICTIGSSVTPGRHVYPDPGRVPGAQGGLCRSRPGWLTAHSLRIVVLHTLAAQSALLCRAATPASCTGAAATPGAALRAGRRRSRARWRRRCRTRCRPRWPTGCASTCAPTCSRCSR